MNAFPLPQGHIFRRPKLPSLSASERRVLYNSMISTLARLHSIDWRSLGLSDFGHQTNYLRRQVRLSKMGDSRKYPYHTTGGILEFRGRGGVSWTGIPKTWGGNAVWNSKGMGGCFSSEFSEFPEERRRKLRLKSLTC